MSYVDDPDFPLLCACGSKLVSCHGCAGERCLTCDPYSDYERLNRCCVTTFGKPCAVAAAEREVTDGC